MTTPRLGIAFVPTHAPESLRRLATTAEEAGLDDLWVWEDCFKQSGLASAAAAIRTIALIRRVRRWSSGDISPKPACSMLGNVRP